MEHHTTVKLLIISFFSFFFFTAGEICHLVITDETPEVTLFLLHLKSHVEI